MVRPKKSLGQHFLTDQHIAERIVESIGPDQQMSLLEIGPGTEVLTRFLTQYPGLDLKLAEIDREAVAYLHQHFPSLGDRIIEGDFLEMEMKHIFDGKFSIIGNFPYNISSQIFFHVLDSRDQVETVVCMLQKEVADRLAAPPGSKTYGILSVLLQAWYDVKMLFKVPPGVFFPPPKVMSAVIRVSRNQRVDLGCDEVLFRKVVKQSFQMRRKTLRNALKSLNLPASLTTMPVFDLRAERLSVDDFILLTQQIRRSGEGV